MFGEDRGAGCWRWAGISGGRAGCGASLGPCDSAESPSTPWGMFHEGYAREEEAASSRILSRARSSTGYEGCPRARQRIHRRACRTTRPHPPSPTTPSPLPSPRTSPIPPAPSFPRTPTLVIPAKAGIQSYANS